MTQQHAESSLPAGLTHPYDATVAKAETFRHGHTFTWSRGDAYVAVQRGRIANARRVTVITDDHEQTCPQVGRHRVVDWLPAPAQQRWGEPTIMRQVADHWLAVQRATVRAP